MAAQLSYSAIHSEFENSFGFIRNDLRAVCAGKETINYTVMLLVGCGCEMLAAARGDRKHPARILEEILEPEWKPLANALFSALRNGLAHGFDTKHLIVDGVSYQIYMQWKARAVVRLHRTPLTTRLEIGPPLLAARICQKIDELQALLRADAGARATWFEHAHRYDRERPLNRHELEAWSKLS
jgi:hypothetical protein